MNFNRRDLPLSGTSIGVTMAATGSAAAQKAPTAPAMPPAVAGGDTAENIPVPATEHHINIITLRDLEAEAQKVLAAYSFAFAAGGAGDEWTMRENEAAIDRWVIEPNFLSGHSAPDLTTTLFGSKLGMPVITAPVATCKRKPK